MAHRLRSVHLVTAKRALPEAGVLPTLHGARVALRHIEPRDAGSLRAIFGDPQVARYIGVPLLRTGSQVQRLLQEIRRGVREQSVFQWGVALRDAGDLVGTCTLAQISWANQRAEVGFALGSSYWGKGLMREALPILVDHAFGALALHRLEADVDPRNASSLRLLRLLGFQEEGYLRERHLVGNERQDTVLLGLLAEEWQTARRDG